MSLLEILYCDNHLLALHKPAGLLTQPSGTSSVSLEDLGKQWLKQEYHKPGAVFLEAVHRLDRLASGIVLFARTSKALRRLNASIRNGDCEKFYIAIVEGRPRSERARLVNWLLHGDHRAVVSSSGTPNSKESILDYEVLTSDKDLSLLRVHLLTGRYHQIRAQLSHAGTPIWGDFLYGAKQRFTDQGIALQHCHFRIPHPVTKQWLEVKVRDTLKIK